MTLRELRASTRALFIVAAAAIGTAAVSAPQEARAADDGEFLLTLDGALAFPVSDPFDSAYNIGFYGGLGAYWAPKGMWSMGARLHAGMLGGDDGFGTDNLGYGLLTAAIRLRPLGNHGYSRGDGFWVEIGAGVGMMDDLLGDGVDVQPAFEASMGYHVQSGTIDVGPYIGVTHILRAEDEGTGLGGEDLIVMQFGVSIGFFDSRKPAAEPEPEPEPPVVVTPPPTEPVRPKRPDNFSVDETVFFDYNKSELREEGKARLDEIVEYWEDDGDKWAALIVAGHADERGPADYNVELSQRRADAVAAYLVSRGIPRDKIDTVAYGEYRPAIPDATTPEEYQANRRVEFTIQRNL